MMKRLILAALAAVLLLSAAGCGKDAKKAVPVEAVPAEPELETVAETLLESDIFGEKLTEVDPEVGTAVFGIDSAAIDEAIFYMSTGATAEELALFKATNEDGAKSIQAALDARIEQQKASYASYGPAEVPKLEKTNIEIVGTTVVYCVSSDSAKAQDLIESCF